MKLAPLITLAFSFLLIEPHHAEDRVFLLGGQSNMSGAGLYDQLDAKDQEPPEGVKIWHENKWQKIVPGVSANEGRFGPELAFGRAIRNAYPDDAVYLIKTAAGGTSMHKHWHVENGGGGMYRQFLSKASKALKELDDQTINYTISGMLWMQGESDADQGMGAEYEDSLKEFIKTVRDEFKQKDLPFIMGRILPTFDKPEGNGPLVRAAQEKTAKEIDHVACFNTDDFERINKGHYNHNGQLTLGKTFAEHYLKLVSAKESESQPKKPTESVWIGTDGRSITASFVSLENDKLTLKNRSGQVYSFDLSRLNEESQDHAKDCAAKVE